MCTKAFDKDIGYVIKKNHTRRDKPNPPTLDKLIAHIGSFNEPAGAKHDCVKEVTPLNAGHSRVSAIEDSVKLRMKICFLEEITMKNLLQLSIDVRRYLISLETLFIIQ